MKDIRMDVYGSLGEGEPTVKHQTAAAEATIAKAKRKFL
jgi:hypothetical protein